MREARHSMLGDPSEIDERCSVDESERAVCPWENQVNLDSVFRNDYLASRAYLIYFIGGEGESTNIPDYRFENCLTLLFRTLLLFLLERYAVTHG